MATAGGGIHVQHTLPYLVAAVETETAAAFEQRREFGRGRVGNERAHNGERIAAGSALSARRVTFALRPRFGGRHRVLVDKYVTGAADGDH